MSGQHCVEAIDRACGKLEVARQRSEPFKISPPLYRLCSGNSRVATVVIGDACASECGCSP